MMRFLRVFFAWVHDPRSVGFFIGVATSSAVHWALWVCEPRW